MPSYFYRAKSQPQKTIQGHIEAESEQDAITKLARMGYFPIAINPETDSLDIEKGLQFRRIPRRDIVLFTHQLSGLLESGVNILNSLNIISTQTANRYLRASINGIIDSIKNGKSLSQSLNLYPNFFSNLYISMVRSGEVGGNIELSLKRLANFLEKEEEFKNSLRASLVYPAFVFLVGVLTVVTLLVFVIPRLVTMFEDMGQLLPLPTRILIGASGLLRNYWLPIVAAISILIFLLLRWKQTQKGRIAWDTLKLKTVVLGEIILKAEISRLMHTLSLLLSSGIPILYSLDISSSVVENQVLKIELQKFKEKINQGLRFSQCLKDSKLFPNFVTNILTVGEETGSLEKSLMHISDSYEKDTDRILKTLSRLLEPVIILVMGLIVGFIVLSMLLPIFQINLIVS